MTTTTEKKEAKKEEMRLQRPITASIVDELRQALGVAKADAIVRKGMQGRGGFWVREQCPDGVVRETGSR
jgi:hypothetical protein